MIKVKRSFEQTGMRYDWLVDSNTAEALEHAIVGEIAKAVAKKFVQDHWTEIISHLDQRATAQMATAWAGAAINETLGKKLPDKIVEKEVTRYRHIHTGLFGRLKGIY